MREPILLPQWGMGMTEGTVTAWLKAVGDRVSEDEEIAEVETAKAVTMLESPFTGELVEIVVQEGETADIYAVLAHVEVD